VSRKAGTFHATTEHTTRAKANAASYAAAVASRGTLTTRLHKSTALGDVLSETYNPAATHDQNHPLHNRID
jgi:hypothetical protein